nr:hypothetical protein [Dendronalium sp. ChiSLP03b]
MRPQNASGDAPNIANGALTAVCYRRKPPSRQRLPFGRRQQVLHQTASPHCLLLNSAVDLIFIANLFTVNTLALADDYQIIPYRIRDYLEE